ncbi:MAG: hypothetical protein KDI09_06690 [Halioglobus sp.]|nr:hypothetical protein [Halioglobus sp.]
MSDNDLLQGEQFPHKISGEYESEDAARHAAELLINNAGLPETQVRVVEPGDPSLSRKVEPESRGIARTLVKSHITLGLAGLVSGLVLAALLVTFGPALTRSSPLQTFIVFGALFSMTGLILAGAVSLRPDHDPLIVKTQHAARSGRWSVIAHCADFEEKARAKNTIDFSSQTA